MNLAAAVVAAVLTITTQNVRVSLPPPQAHHDIEQAAEHSTVVFTQEMGLRRAQAFAPQHWGSAHAPGLRRGDCATYYDRRVWVKRAAWPTLLTAAPFRAGTRYALTTILHMRGHPGVTLAAVCVHLITRSLARRVVYAHGIARLHALLTRLERFPYVVVGGDWNRVWPLRAPLPGTRSWEPPRATGTHGGRIDYLRWAPGVVPRTIRVIGHTFSDHNGVRMRLVLRR